MYRSFVKQEWNIATAEHIFLRYKDKQYQWKRFETYITLIIVE